MRRSNEKNRQQSSGERIRNKGWHSWLVGSHPMWREFITAAPYVRLLSLQRRSVNVPKIPK